MILILIPLCFVIGWLMGVWAAHVEWSESWKKHMKEWWDE